MPGSSTTAPSTSSTGASSAASAYESLHLLEEEINKRLKTGLLKVYVAIVPLARDQLFTALQDGKVDLVAATLTITPERRKSAEFSMPTRTNVSEIVVTAPNVAPLATPDDLSGREVFVRRSSSYYESLSRLNEVAGEPRQAAGGRSRKRPRRSKTTTSWRWSTPDWSTSPSSTTSWSSSGRRSSPASRPLKNVAVRTGGDIAVGVRKNNPQMLRAVNMWIKKYGPRTAFGNMMERRYLQNVDYVKNAATEKERAKLRDAGEVFRDLRRQVRRRLPADGGPGLPGIAARPVGEEPRRRDWRDAGDARDRKRSGGRGHHQGRTERPRGGQVLQVHDGHVLQERADGPR